MIAYHSRTRIFCKLADVSCTNGLKGLHEYLTNTAVLAQAFPIDSHSKSFTDCWIDMWQYNEIESLSANHSARFYNAGIMINGRVYSLDVIPKYEPFMPIKEILQSDSVNEKYFIKSEEMQRWKYAKGAKREQRRRKDGTMYWFSEGAVPFPDAHDKPSRTILTSESKPGRTSHVVKDLQTGKLRTLTPIECERLNGFPDNWTNTGTPEQMRYFTMGNALVVPIVTRIGKCLLPYIEQK